MAASRPDYVKLSSEPARSEDYMNALRTDPTIKNMQAGGLKKSIGDLSPDQLVRLKEVLEETPLYSLFQHHEKMVTNTLLTAYQERNTLKAKDLEKVMTNVMKKTAEGRGLARQYGGESPPWALRREPCLQFILSEAIRKLVPNFARTSQILPR